MRELLQMARDIAFGCRYLEENHFIHRFKSQTLFILRRAQSEHKLNMGINNYEIKTVTVIYAFIVFCLFFSD